MLLDRRLRSSNYTLISIESHGQSSLKRFKSELQCCDVEMGRAVVTENQSSHWMKGGGAGP